MWPRSRERPAGPAISPSFRKAGPISGTNHGAGAVANRIGGSVLNIISIPISMDSPGAFSTAQLFSYREEMSSNPWRNFDL